MFLFFYQNSSGPVAWLYFTETSIDASLGFTLFTLWGTVFILSLVCPILLNEPEEGGVGPDNVFYGLSFLCFLGSLYGKIFMYETKGLTDKEKKSIYTPASMARR
jgi:hypothetical protein